MKISKQNIINQQKYKSIKAKSLSGMSKYIVGGVGLYFRKCCAGTRWWSVNLALQG
jgi:hypothetical protein